MEDGQTTFEVKIRWMRILIGGFLDEAVLILLVIPVSMNWWFVADPEMTSR
jgi:hypothetical protein